MKDLKDLTLRELVEQVADCLRRDTTVTGLKVLQEIKRRLAEIEAAVDGMEAVDTYDRNTGDTVYSIKCKLSAYRAAKAERRGDARQPESLVGMKVRTNNGEKWTITDHRPEEFILEMRTVGGVLLDDRIAHRDDFTPEDEHEQD